MWKANDAKRGDEAGRSRRWLILLPLAIALGGCSMIQSPGPVEILPANNSGGDTGDDAGGGAVTITDAGSRSASDDAGTADLPKVDEPAILASIARGAFRTSSDFVHVTEAPYPSAAATGSTIDEWVSATGAAAYMAISPNGGAPAATIPAGTTIVREVIDGTGAVSELTLLVKGPAGYNPTIGDWWWGVTDPEGAPVITDAGDEIGRLTQCYSCHIPRKTEGYLFGAPSDDRQGEMLDASAVEVESH